MNPPLLDGVRVLELSRWRPGALAGVLLAQLGAEVLKVEPPGGDPFRGYPALFATHNAGKRSIALDLRTDGGRARLHELARDADALIEGMRPSVAARLGAAYDDLHAVNPSLVYCSISGFGQDGPWAQLPGHDLAYQAYAGLLAPRGGPPPESIAPPIGDISAGLFGAFAVCAALTRRARTGEGEYVDVAMTSLLATMTGLGDPGELADGEAMPGLASYGTYATADGKWVALAFMEDEFWVRLCHAFGVEDLADLDVAQRIAREAELRDMLARECKARTRDELVALGRSADVPIAPVHTRTEMLNADHLRHVQTVVEGPDGPWLGFPARLREHSVSVSTQVPDVGEHRGWAD